MSVLLRRTRRAHGWLTTLLRIGVVTTVVAGVSIAGMDAAFAATPTWPGSTYMGVLQNVQFKIPIAVTAGAPLTAMAVNSAPANVSGFGLQNIDLTHGTADMVGTYTAAPAGSTVTASIKATNASGNSNGSFTLEAYTCSWASTTGTTAVFDSNQSDYVTGSQSAYGTAITNGVTAGTTQLKPTCADIHVPGLGATTLILSNPFSGIITPNNNDNSSAESDMNAGCGTVSIFGTNTGNYGSSNCNGARTVPNPWANGGTLSLSIGTQTDVGDTNTALTACPPSQAAVDAGLVTCTVTGSSGSSSYSWNFSSDEFMYNGQPLPDTTTVTLGASNALAGHTVPITGGTHWWGNSGGAPVAGTGHTQSGSYYAIPAASVYVGATRATAVQATSSVNISPVSYACGQASSSVAPNPCTFTPPAVSGSFTVPNSLTPGAYNVYVDEPNTTPLMGNGPNDSYQTARGTSRGTDEAVASINVVASPSFTSAANASGAEADPFSFTVTTTSTPTAVLSKTGSLPTGLSFHDNGDGTATIAGTPGTGTHGIYAISLAADDGIGGVTHQSFTLTINLAPAITSSPSTTASEGDAFSFLVTADGVPTPSVAESGALPGGVTFTDNGDGTATLAGTPDAGTHGTYPITITATNGIDSPAQQNFSLVVEVGPTITSDANATATEGSAFNFTATATGSPTPGLSLGGALPSGLTFHDNGDGTATISGTPATGTQGVYALTITATNGVGTPAVQNFSLTVDAAPVITSASSATGTEGAALSFTITTTGLPAPAITEDGALPGGVTLLDNGDGTASLSGTPDPGSSGVYPLTITADNGIGTAAQQAFTLTIQVGPAITSADNLSVAGGAPFTFIVTTTGLPAPSVTQTGALPNGVTFQDNGDGTATLAGTPVTGSLGSYPITITADNGVDTAAQQNFTLVVLPVVSTTQATVSTTEGNSPAGKTLNIPINLSEASSQAVTVHYQTNDGPGAHAADGGDDYTAASGTVTIPAGMTSKNIPITILGDTTVEFDETFTVTLSSPTNALLGAQDSTLATITNDDHAKWALSSPSVVEGNSGVTPVSVTIAMTLPSDATVTTHWATADGTAKTTAGHRAYVPASGDLTFAPGETSKTVTVNVRGDTILEDTQYFKIVLSAVTTAIPSGIATTGTTNVQILNDELPTISVNSHVGTEGALFLFKVTLQERYYLPIDLCYSTVDGTATAASGDYTPIAGCDLVIPAGAKAAALPAVTALYDFTSEPQETFKVNVIGPGIALKTGTGTIKANNT